MPSMRRLKPTQAVDQFSYSVLSRTKLSPHCWKVIQISSTAAQQVRSHDRLCHVTWVDCHVITDYMPTESVEGVVRITEARLKRDILERKIIDFCPTDNGFEVVRVDALSAPEGKVRLLHVHYVILHGLELKGLT